MKLLEVEVANFQKVEVVEFQPAREGATLLAGRNEQGKSSTIQAIVSTLQGADELPKEPVRHGAESCRTKLKLGDETVDFEVIQEVTAEPDGTLSRKLTLRDATGAKVKSPQAVLNALYSRVAFDPLAFARAEPGQQDRTLKDLAGVTKPYAELDATRKVAYDKRTSVNAQAKQARARLAGMPHHAKAPAKEVDVAELAKSIDARKEQAHALKSADEAIQRQNDEAARCMGEVTKLQAQLEAAAEKHRAEIAKVDALAAEREKMAPAEPIEELQEQLNTASATNKLVHENQARKEEEKRAEGFEDESKKLTAEIEAIDAKKQDLLAAAQFPVEGLGFNDLGPTLNGVPLSQASTARTLELSYAVGVAQNPDLKLLIIREGAFFDEEALAALDERARKDGVQVLVERVGTRDKGSNVVIIESGRVRNAAEAV